MSSILEKNTVSELSIWASTPPMPIKAKPFDLILYRSLTDVAHTEIKLNFHIFTNAKIETVGIQIFIAQNLHFIVCKLEALKHMQSYSRWILKNEDQLSPFGLHTQEPYQGKTTICYY